MKFRVIVTTLYTAGRSELLCYLFDEQLSVCFPSMLGNVLLMLFTVIFYPVVLLFLVEHRPQHHKKYYVNKIQCLNEQLCSDDYAISMYWNM